MLKRLAKFPLTVWRACLWALGRRRHHWLDTPVHRRLRALADVAYGKASLRYRMQYMVAAALLKYRERVHADHINFDVRLGATPGAETLRNLALWEQQVLAIPPFAPYAHVNLHVDGARDTIEVDQLMSLLLLSDRFSSVSLFFDHEAPRRARVSAQTLAEEGRNPVPLDDVPTPTAAQFDAPQWANIFSPHTGFDRGANAYFKASLAGALVVVLELPENARGFCDDALAPWEAAANTFAATHPEAKFVVLNRVGPAVLKASAAWARGAVLYVRSAGLTLGEAIAVARRADAYIGELGVFGIAARSAGRRGIYMSSAGERSLDAARGILHTAPLSPAEAMDQLAKLLAGNAVAPQPRAEIPRPAASRQVPPAPISRAEPVRAASAGAEPYTLLIPTFNRPELLGRLLRYLKRAGADFPIVVLDSTLPEKRAEVAKAIEQGPAGVRLLEYPADIDPYVKIRQGLEAVTTPYSSVCADDDLVIVPAVRACVAALEADADAVLAHGYYANFSERMMFELIEVVYRGPSLANDSPMRRVRDLFAHYEAVFYGVYRTSAALAALHDIEKLSSVLVRELLAAGRTVALGKTVRVPHFYYGRSTGESHFYSDWHPHEMLVKSPAGLFRQYAAFREGMSGVLEADPQARAADIVDLAMLRYLSPFLRPDILDYIMDRLSNEQGSEAIVRDLWEAYARAPVRPARAVEPLITRRGGPFGDDKMWAANKAPQDYVHESKSPAGERRSYRFHHEFFYPERDKPAYLKQEQVLALVAALDRY